jgi:phosphatidylglycerol---prolipoprotein diacylglyceryl transferase
MLAHPQFDPVAIHLGTFSLPWIGSVTLDIRWYGLMYLAGFLLALVLGRYRIRARPDLGWTLSELDDALVYAVLGVILGGRLGYVLFYTPEHYWAHPGEIFAVWHGGMSFHGGLLGMIVAMGLFARKHRKSVLDVTDFVSPLAPLGLFLGRIGNFINGELPGRVTSVPWAMVFPQVDDFPRHPSQLYEAALEGLALFAVVWGFSAQPRPLGAVSAVFLTGYGIFRFLVEFTRQPDDFLGLLALNLSMGQWLSLPMIVAGVTLFLYSYRFAPER